MQVPAAQESIAEIARGCAAAGLDLVQPFAVQWYNAGVADAHKLPTYGRDPCLGILIGNTRELWPRFVRALRATPALLDDEHPIDSYVEDAVMRACAALPYRYQSLWAQRSRQVAIQQLAQRAGLAYLSPGHLSVHPTFGPWIALRAVIVVDVAGPSVGPPAIALPCADCHDRCAPAFARAAATLVEPVNQAAVTPHWHLWLAARDACPIGREYRYDDDQIGYHYTKDKRFLRQALSRSR